jgi:group I intron endonuclease
MVYYIYKITNINTGKFYIGSHKTKDLHDGYFGSGIYLKRSIAKYGKDSFKKENIYFFNTEEEMRKKETDLLIFYKNHEIYNLKFCALGGNTREKYTSEQKHTYIQKLINNPDSPIGKRGVESWNYGKKLKETVKIKQSESHKKRYKEIRENAVMYNEFKIQRAKTAKENIKKAIYKNQISITVFDDITANQNIYFKSIRECAEKLNVSRHVLSYYIKSSEQKIILLSQINKLITQLKLRRFKSKLKKDRKIKTVYKLLNKENNIEIQFNNIKNIIKHLNINYDQVRILQTRKIYRNCYCNEFLNIYDKYILTKCVL